MPLIYSHFPLSKFLRSSALACVTTIGLTGCVTIDDLERDFNEEDTSDGVEGLQTADGVAIKQVQISPPYQEDAAPTAAPREVMDIGFYMESMSASAAPRVCKASKLDLEISISPDGSEGSFRALDDDAISASCVSDVPFDLALVVDNSGSQADVLEDTKDAALRVVDLVLGRGGRVSLTRVSTQAEQLVPLTTDRAALEAAIDGMFVNEGWTALFDAVRVAHESLGSNYFIEGRVEDDLSCRVQRRSAVVVVSNGIDNNSASEKTPDVSDGIDTTSNDLSDMHINGVTTPVYTIGLGDRLDTAELATMASATGGRYITIPSMKQLSAAFTNIVDAHDETLQVCTRIPRHCGGLYVEIDYDYDHGSSHHSGTERFHVVGDCPPGREIVAGRTAVALLQLSGKGISDAVASSIVENSVDWVTPIDDPAVLVVMDDDNHNEGKQDLKFIAELMGDLGFEYTSRNEPKRGLSAADVAGYDVVWFTNPGYPVDDLLTQQTLRQFSVDGGGLVLSGDDMSWAKGQGFSMEPLTGLRFKTNGTSTCGKPTDNERGHALRVSVADVDHMLARNLRGQSFQYWNDIDQSQVVSAHATVLASATLDAPNHCASFPVIVGIEPED